MATSPRPNTFAILVRGRSLIASVSLLCLLLFRALQALDFIELGGVLPGVTELSCPTPMALDRLVPGVQMPDIKDPQEHDISTSHALDVYQLRRHRIATHPVLSTKTC
jgi:hypothetical protein